MKVIFFNYLIRLTNKNIFFKILVKYLLIKVTIIQWTVNQSFIKTKENYLILSHHRVKDVSCLYTTK